MIAAQLAALEAVRDAESPEEALARLLPALGGALQWQAGCLWAAADARAAELCCEACWIEGPQAAAFAQACRTITFTAGEGLPGAAWASGQPVVVRDVQADPRFNRGKAAKAAGLHGALAVPLALPDGRPAVLELLTSNREAVDDGLLAAVSAIAAAALGAGSRPGRGAATPVAAAAYDAIFAANQDAVVVMDAGGTIGAINRAAEHMFGYASELAVGRRMADILVPPDLRPAFEEGLAQFLETGHGKILGERFESTALNVSGKTFPVEITVTAADGLPAMMFAAQVRDLTEERQREEVLARATEFRSELLGLISHELRSPLATIAANIEALSRIATSATAEERAIIGELGASTERLSRVVAQMLSLGRLATSGVPTEPVLLHRLIAEVVARFEKARPGRRVLVETAPDLPPVLAEPTFSEQVLENLLSNAHKYGPLEKPIHVSAVRNGSHVEVQVRDEGDGMSSEEIRHLFDPFFRAERTAARAQGIGLGLTVCKRLVQAQHGRIWAQTPPEGGAAFGFSLPVAEVCDDG